MRHQVAHRLQQGSLIYEEYSTSFIAYLWDYLAFLQLILQLHIFHFSMC